MFNRYLPWLCNKNDIDDLPLEIEWNFELYVYSVISQRL